MESEICSLFVFHFHLADGSNEIIAVMQCVRDHLYLVGGRRTAGASSDCQTASEPRKWKRQWNDWCANSVMSAPFPFSQVALIVLQFLIIFLCVGIIFIMAFLAAFLSPRVNFSAKQPLALAQVSLLARASSLLSFFIQFHSIKPSLRLSCLQQLRQRPV